MAPSQGGSKLHFPIHTLEISGGLPRFNFLQKQIQQRELLQHPGWKQKSQNYWFIMVVSNLKHNLSMFLPVCMLF